MVHVRSCIPELFFLKYRAIPTPWECEGNAKRIGFKCIKYASWKDVHPNTGSAKTLREIGNLLVDEGSFPLQLYGEFALVWERVRRWGSDKEGFSIEPDFTPEFESTSRAMSLGLQDGMYVLSLIRDTIAGFSPQSADIAWAAFKRVIVTNLLSRSKAVGALKIPVPLLDDLQAAPAQKVAIDEFIVKLYAALGFEILYDTAGEVIDLLLEELGFSVSAPPISTGDQPATRALSDVLVERKDRLDARLLEAKMVGNSMILTLNGRHPALQADSPYCAYFADAGHWQAIGRACRDHLGNLEEVQSFLDSWGVHLASLMRASRRQQNR